MGFAVLHIQKSKGNDSGTTAHIERTVNPANAEPQRKHLNKEFIVFPDGVETRTQAIQHRIENAGIKRKISHNQVRALQVMLSGTPEDMQAVQADGSLDDWCKDNIDWLQNTFGEDNVVSAVLHMDEKTPHIHATVVPIVTGERRKAREKKKTDEPGKKTYRKKNPDAARLCADDVMTRENLERFQDSYAERMGKYGLRRGIKGSDARHITTPQYYREVFHQTEELKENIECLQEERTEVYEKVRDMYDRKDEAQEKFWAMHQYNEKKETEITEVQTRLEQLRQEYEPYRAQEDLNLIIKVFPQIGERLRVIKLCRSIGLTVENIKMLFKGEVLTFTGKLYSPEHDRDFTVHDGKMQIMKDGSHYGKFRLILNGSDILEWFRERYLKIKQKLNPTTRAENKGIKF